LDPVATLKKELFRMKKNYLESVIGAVAISKKYEGYILRANQENERIIRFGKKRINWERICQSPNISNECRQRIKEIRPETFGQLQRINGLRPATLAFVAGSLA
jgi:tRNA uridine 5-carboxymethylaminomethyl modification enzyme